MTEPTFASGSLVRVRGREWVVLPESTDRLLRLRPLGGTDAESTGILLDLEQPEPARFDLPATAPGTLGDWQSCRLLRDAVRLGFRSSAGPFRSFAGIAVEPRPYQLVPLMMALKLEPVRLLIGDDVGVGKTIEAGLIARELIDRREVQRFAVLCPPHLAEQWQAELRDKFHIQAELVLASTAARLERRCVAGRSIFETFSHVIVSTDFIKSLRRRDDFLREAPELVIVDEAHTCAFDSSGRSSRHQRYELVRSLADSERHLILVTATPHTGKEETFRSLLGLLDKQFLELPDDLTGKANEPLRRRVAAHFIQRRRGDIRHFMQADTPFPDRKELEAIYNLHSDYKKLFDRVLAYARETVLDNELGKHKRRVRWWSMLALLRALSSSPAAAAATLRTRASVADTEDEKEANAIGRESVMDIDDPEAEVTDVIPGSDYADGEDEAESAPANRERRRLQEMARVADKLQGKKDEKIATASREIKKLIDDGFAPIVFCRFIATAEYVAEQLRERLPKTVAIETVTGSLPPAEREERVEQLKQHEKRVLVCTDCLSEGVNLQDRFTAVVHYDLSWSPTRHEQREGRVDRYGQNADEIRVLTLWGTDTQIDGIVLDTLLRKHKKIRSSLGISVPVPVETDQVVEAIFEGLLLRESSGGEAEPFLPGFESYFEKQKQELHDQWDEAVTREEKRSNTMFAQQSIKADEVQQELAAAREAGGAGLDVRDFMIRAVEAHSGVATSDENRGRSVAIDLDRVEVPLGLRDTMGEYARFTASFEFPPPDTQVYLHRTHPAVEALAGYTMNTALDPQTAREARAKRAGAIRTREVSQLTTVLLVRTRYEIITTRRDQDPRSLMAEDCRVLAFTGLPNNPQWLSEDEARGLVEAELGPDANTPPQQAATFLNRILGGFDALWPDLEENARQHAQKLLDAHRRVRAASQDRGVNHEVQPKLPPDVLGIYVYLPMGASN